MPNWFGYFHVSCQKDERMIIYFQLTIRWDKETYLRIKNDKGTVVWISLNSKNVNFVDNDDVFDEALKDHEIQSAL